MNNLSPSLEAAYQLVEHMKQKADAYEGMAPLWYGWAIRVAFLKGVEFGRKEIQDETTEKG